MCGGWEFCKMDGVGCRMDSMGEVYDGTEAGCGVNLRDQRNVCPYADVSVPGECMRRAVFAASGVDGCACRVCGRGGADTCACKRRPMHRSNRRAAGGRLHGTGEERRLCRCRGVTITAQNSLTGKRYSTTSDIAGVWTLTIPQNGRYVIRTQFAAFAQGAARGGAECGEPRCDGEF